jgi:hypothetical protein
MMWPGELADALDATIAEISRQPGSSKQTEQLRKLRSASVILRDIDRELKPFLQRLASRGPSSSSSS